ncbi:hypothetical protein LINGRAHAP2_LOCUS25654 [Linum grandiflorum]
MDSELDPFIDVFDEEPAAPRAKPAVKFQPKARPRKPKATASAAAPPVAPPPPPTAAAPVTQPTDALIHSANDEVPVPASNQESVVSSAFGGGEMETKDRVASATVAGAGAVDSDRLQSEDSRERTDVVSEPVEPVFASDDVESLVPPESSFVAPLETRHESEGAMPAAQEEYDYDLLSLGFDDFVPSAPASSEFPINSEQTGDQQTCVLNEAGKDSREDEPDRVEKESRDNGEKIVLESNVSSLGSDRSGGKLSMQLRKRSGARQVLDESESESVNDDISFPAEEPDGLGKSGDNDYEYRMEEVEDDGQGSTSKKKKAAKRSKKSASGEEKPSRKRKKASDTSEQSEQKQPKKFSHSSTRRKKRYRNDELLKVPEDEIEFRSLPMRDIIFLAEHKERLKMPKLLCKLLLQIKQSMQQTMKRITPSPRNLWTYTKPRYSTAILS